MSLIRTLFYYLYIVITSRYGLFVEPINQRSIFALHSPFTLSRDVNERTGFIEFLK